MDRLLVSPGKEQFEENLRQRNLEEEKDSLLKERELIEFPNRAEGFAHIFELRDGQPVEHVGLPDPDVVVRARAELAQEEQEQKAASERRRDRRELLQKLNEGTIRFLHICECCGKTEFLTPEEAFQAGWDYPPTIGTFGVIGPRTCGNCTMDNTLWWAVAEKKIPLDQLSPAQEAAMVRILGEPWNLLEKGDQTGRIPIFWKIEDH